MVRDDVLGLVWEVKTNNGDIHDADNVYSLNDAQDIIIAQLNRDKFGGYTDWRLPTIFELTTLVFPESSRPAGNLAYFPNTKSRAYWSSTSYAGFEGRWYLNMYHGETVVWSEPTHNYAMNNRVRAVRGEKIVGNLVDNGDSTVSDTITQLTWQQGDSGPMDWQKAFEYCEDLKLSSYNDWRLPNRNELASIISYENTDPAIDTTVFPNTTSSIYLTSTIPWFRKTVWTVHFFAGEMSHYYHNGLVRCVRGGQ